MHLAHARTIFALCEAIVPGVPALGIRTIECRRSRKCARLLCLTELTAAILAHGFYRILTEPVRAAPSETKNDDQASARRQNTGPKDYCPGAAGRWQPHSCALIDQSSA